MTLTPIFVRQPFQRSRRDGTLTQTTGADAPPYDTALTTARTGTSLARLNSEWTHRFAPEARMEWRAGLGQARAPVNSFRTEYTGGSESRTLEETSRSRDTSVTASGKLVAQVFEGHSFVSGIELESNRRVSTRGRACRTGSRS